MGLSIEHLEDYNRRIKLGKNKISCYSKKGLERKYPNKGYYLYGETTGAFDEKKHKNKHCELAEYDEKLTLAVSPYRSNSRASYKEAGYLSTGNDRYVVLLKSRLPLFIHLAVFLIVLICAAVALHYMTLPPTPPPEPPPTVAPEKDPGAIKLPDDTPPAEGSGTLSLSYILKAKVSESTGEIGMYVSNPAKSNKNIVIQLFVKRHDGDLLLSSSGLIPRAHSLTSMTADKDALALLKKGEYEGYFKISCYDAESGKRELIEPQISDLSVTVID